MAASNDSYNMSFTAFELFFYKFLTFFVELIVACYWVKLFSFILFHFHTNNTTHNFTHIYKLDSKKCHILDLTYRCILWNSISVP